MDKLLRAIGTATKPESTRSTWIVPLMTISSTIFALSALLGPAVLSADARASCEAQQASGLASACAVDVPAASLSLYRKLDESDRSSFEIIFSDVFFGGALALGLGFTLA